MEGIKNVDETTGRQEDPDISSDEEEVSVSSEEFKETNRQDGQPAVRYIITRNAKVTIA